MTTVEEKFAEVWAEQVEDRKRHSPSFELADYTITGRAPAKYGGKRNVDWWMDFGPNMVRSWINWREQAKWPLAQIGGKPAVEVELNFQLPGCDMPIKAFIDRVFEPLEGDFTVVDLKTGSRTPESEEQLGLYRVGLGLVHGIWPEWGFWWSPDKGLSAPMNLEAWTPERLAIMFNNSINGINAGVFNPNPANNCKAWCGVSRFCAVVGGAEAHGVDPLAV